MDLNELDQQYNEWLEEYEAYAVEDPPPLPKQTLVPVHRPGTAMHSINVAEASKTQMLALKDGRCPTCGGSAGAYCFDNIMLYYCHGVTHHRFKETLNWS